MKFKLALLEIVQLIIVLMILTLVILYFTNVISFNIVAIGTAISALFFAMVIVFDVGWEDKRERKVMHLMQREDISSLLFELQDSLNNLGRQNKIIDSVQVSDIVNDGKNLKGAYIIYH